MAENTRKRKKKKKRPGMMWVVYLIFATMVIYIVYLGVTLWGQKHIAGYEVKQGSLTTSSIYRGLAIRDEEVVYSEDNGYINYFVAEGTKARYNQLVYTIDHSGELTKLFRTDNEISDLTKDDLSILKESLIELEKNYDSAHFDTIYQGKKDIYSEIYYIANTKIQSDIEVLNTVGSKEQVVLGRSKNPGYVVYSYDGYEDKNAEEITTSDFDEENYTNHLLLSQKTINHDEPVYKLVTSELWTLIVPVNDEIAKKLIEEKVVKVKFTKTQQYSWSNVTVSYKNNQHYAYFSFNNSVMKFADSRFVDIELFTDNVTGLKIPNTAIKEKQFFLIPLKYVIKNENTDTYEVFKKTYDENGQENSKAFKVYVHNETEEYYYVESDELNFGDILNLLDSQETYTITQAGTLIGVYNINKAYADFKQITILEQNDEYAIIQPNNKYGLTVFDRIVLDASEINDDTFIYK